MKCPYKIKYQVRVPRIMADGNQDLQVTEQYYESASYDRAMRKAMDAFYEYKAFMVVLRLLGPIDPIDPEHREIEYYRTHIIEMTQGGKLNDESGN